MIQWHPHLGRCSMVFGSQIWHVKCGKLAPLPQLSSCCAVWMIHSLLGSLGTLTSPPQKKIPKEEEEVGRTKVDPPFRVKFCFNCYFTQCMSMSWPTYWKRCTTCVTDLISTVKKKKKKEKTGGKNTFYIISKNCWHLATAIGIFLVAIL